MLVECQMLMRQLAKHEQLKCLWVTSQVVGKERHGEGNCGSQPSGHLTVSQGMDRQGMYFRSILVDRESWGRALGNHRSSFWACIQGVLDFTKWSMI